MKLEYTLTLADYKAALRIHMRQTLGRRLRVILLRVGIPILAIAGVIAVSIPGRKTELRSDLIAIEIGLIVLSFALPVARYFDARICFKRIFPNPTKVPTFCAEIDREGIRTQNPGVSEGLIFWKAIVRFAQDEKVTMFYIDKRRFLFFPTNILSSAQRTELNDLAASLVVRS